MKRSLLGLVSLSIVMLSFFLLAYVEGGQIQDKAKFAAVPAAGLLGYFTYKFLKKTYEQWSIKRQYAAIERELNTIKYELTQMTTSNERIEENKFMKIIKAIKDLKEQTEKYSENNPQGIATVLTEREKKIIEVIKQTSTEFDQECIRKMIMRLQRSLSPQLLAVS